MFAFSEMLSSSNSFTFSRPRVLNFCRRPVFLTLVELADVVEVDRIEKAGIAMKTIKPPTLNMATPTTQEVYGDDDMSLLSTFVTDVVLCFTAVLVVFPLLSK